MKSLKKFTAFLALSIAISLLFPIEVFATDLSNGEIPPITNDPIVGTTRPTTPPESYVESPEDGFLTPTLMPTPEVAQVPEGTEISEDTEIIVGTTPVEDESDEQKNQTSHLAVTVPTNVVSIHNGMCHLEFNIVNENFEIISMHFGEGNVSDPNSLPLVTTTTFDIPKGSAATSYSFIVVGVDIFGNQKTAVAQVSVNCEEEPTPEPTPTPAPNDEVQSETLPPEQQGCPDGQTMDANGNCYTPTNSCPEGYIKDVNGTCVLKPTECADNQTLDVNGNCVDKVTSLPQTGGFDSLMILFLFGCGLAICGAGLFAYTKQAERKNKK